MDNNDAMGRWSDVRHEAPDVAEFATRLWPGISALEAGLPVPTDEHTFSIAFLATVRHDGGPRLHPFCPILADGRLFGAIPRRSPKGWDLRRDRRCVIHALPGPQDDELSIRAEATEVTEDPPTRELVQTVVSRSAVGGMVESAMHDPIFEFDVVQVDVARWVDIGLPGTHAVRRQWRDDSR